MLSLSLSLSLGSGGAASGGVTPPPTPTGLIALGPSLVQLGGGSTSSTTLLSDRLIGGGFGGTLPQAIDNKIMSVVGWNYGVSSTTSLNAFYRLSTASVQDGTGTDGANTAFSINGISADKPFNIKSAGNYTPLTHPSNYVLAVGLFANDPGLGAAYYTNAGISMDIGNNILDALHGANKYIVMLTELPRGRATYWAEAVTGITAGSTYTALNTPTVSFVDSESFDRPEPVLSNANAVMTKMVSATNLNGGEYFINPATGVYTFGPTGTGTGSAPTGAFVTYSSGNTNTTYLITKILQQWQQSAAANFTDTVPGSGVTWNKPGALYGRASYMTVVDVHTGMADASGNWKGGYSYDGLHLSTVGVAYVRKQVAAALVSLWGASQPAAFKSYPTQTSVRVRRLGSNEINITSGVGSVLTLTGRILSGLDATTVSTLKFYGVDANAISGTQKTYSVTDNGNGTGTITGTNIDTGAVGHGVTKNFVNYSTGAFQIQLQAGTAFSNLTNLYATRDIDNRIPNAFFETINASAGSAGGNWTFNGGAAAAPTNWTFSTDAGTTTAITGGGLTVAVSQTTDPETGDPAIQIAVAGIAGTGAPRFTMAPGVSAGDAQQSTRFVAGDPLFTGARVHIKPGANGHLYGLAAVRHRNAYGITAHTFNAGYVNATTLGAQTNSGSVTLPMTNGFLQGSAVVSEHLLSPPLDTTGLASTAAPSNDFQIDFVAGKPVSFIVIISGVMTKQYAGEGPYPM